MTAKSFIKNAAIFILACIVAAALFAFLYYYDNKYNTTATVTQVYVTELFDDEAVALVDGWEVYPNELLFSGEFEGKFPVRTSIGQYSSFSKFHENGSPYGTATYRLVVQGRGEPVLYTVLMTEVFSACVVYVNGEKVASSGSISPYNPSVEDVAFSFSLKDSAEIVIQTANYTHYYSGITYPPIVGSPYGVHRLASARMIAYGVLCFSSLAIALFSVAIWLGKRNLGGDRLSLWFGIFAVSFSVRVAYPFLHLSALPLIRPIYALEDAMFLLGIWCALKITLVLSGLDRTKAGRIISNIGLYFLLVGVLIPLIILPFAPAFVPVYGQIIYWYKLISALALAALALCGKAGLPLAGIAVYSTGLLAHGILLGRFEPMYTAWVDEYGTYFLVLCFGATMVARSFTLVKENIHLNNHLSDEVAEKTKNLNAVLEDRRRFLASAAHDLKAPMTSLRTFAQLVEDSGVGLDAETVSYIGAILRKTDEMQSRLMQIQTFALQDARPQHMEALDLGGLVRKFHAENLPDMEVAGVSFLMNTSLRPCMVLGDRQRLNSVLQNIVYNALSFTPMDGVISINLEANDGCAVLVISDTGVGISAESLPKIFDRFFSSRRDEGGAGLGLYIAKTTVMEHGGELFAASELGKGSVFTVRLPLIGG